MNAASELLNATVRSYYAERAAERANRAAAMAAYAYAEAVLAKY